MVFALVICIKSNIVDMRVFHLTDPDPFETKITYRKCNYRHLYNGNGHYFKIY